MIVRDIDVYTGDVGGPVMFFEDHSTGGAWWAVQGETITKHYEGWRGRQVFDDEGFDVRVESGGWDIRVSGYLLDA